MKLLGAVFKPEDKFRRRIERALDDLDPNVRDAVKNLIEQNKGEDLERKLRELVGFERTKKLLERMKIQELELDIIKNKLEMEKIKNGNKD